CPASGLDGMECILRRCTSALMWQIWRMPDDEPPEKVWDEYDWERFLQQQDRKTEKYMELLERYIDDPDRDQIIAREMGWNHLLNKEGQEWADHVDSKFSDELDGVLEEEEETSSPL